MRCRGRGAKVFLLSISVFTVCPFISIRASVRTISSAFGDQYTQPVPIEWPFAQQVHKLGVWGVGGDVTPLEQNDQGGAYQISSRFSTCASQPLLGWKDSSSTCKSQLSLEVVTPPRNRKTLSQGSHTRHSVSSQPVLPHPSEGVMTLSQVLPS